MSTKWIQWQIGKVNELPNTWLLETLDTLDVITSANYARGDGPQPGDLVFAKYIDTGKEVSTVFSVQEDGPDLVLIDISAGTGSVTGGVNLPGGIGVYAGLSGSDMQFRSIVGTNGVVAVSTGNTIQLSAPASSQFEYVETIFVAQNGNDANSGKNANEPKLTVQNAVTTLSTGGVVNILDNGVYAPVSFPAGQDYVINAFGASFNTASSGPLFTIAGDSNIVINCFEATVIGQLISNSANSILTINAYHTLGNITNTGKLYLNVAIIEATINTSNWLLARFDLIAGDVFDTAPVDTLPTCGLFGRLIGGSTGSANLQIYGFVSQVNGTIGGVIFGSFGGIASTKGNGVIWANGVIKQPVMDVATLFASWTASKNDSGRSFVYDSSSNADFTLPEYSTEPDIPVGFYCDIYQLSTGKMQYQSQGSDVVVSPGGDTFTMGGGITRVALLDKASSANSFVNTWAWCMNTSTNP